MCRWNTTKILIIKGKPREVDSCIFDIVKMLNENGYETIASCCGHGKQPVNIALRDGREIFIVNNYEDGRKISQLFPPIN